MFKAFQKIIEGYKKAFFVLTSTCSNFFHLKESSPFYTVVSGSYLTLKKLLNLDTSDSIRDYMISKICSPTICIKKKGIKQKREKRRWRFQYKIINNWRKNHMPYEKRSLITSGSQIIEMPNLNFKLHQ